MIFHKESCCFKRITLSLHSSVSLKACTSNAFQLLKKNLLRGSLWVLVPADPAAAVPEWVSAQRIGSVGNGSIVIHTVSLVSKSRSEMAVAASPVKCASLKSLFCRDGEGFSGEFWICFLKQICFVCNSAKSAYMLVGEE